MPSTDRAGQPVSASIPSPGYDQGAAENPLEAYKTLLGCPLFVVGDGPRVGMGIISRYDDIKDAAHRPDTYSSVVVEPKMGNTRPLIPNDVDPPQHRAWRRLLNPLFAPRAVEVIEPGLREHIRVLLDQVRGERLVDFHAHFSELIPTYAFLDFIGIHPGQSGELLALKDRIVRPPTPGANAEEELAKRRDAYDELVAWVDQAVDDPHQQKGRLLSLLMRATFEGRQLERWEVCDVVANLVLAGIHSTIATIDLMLQYLGAHEGHRRLLFERPELIPHAVEELLRITSPIPGTHRIAARDVEVDGACVKKGAPVLFQLGAANVDPSAFSDPDRVDFGRDPNHHFAFGTGPHLCLGVHLARVELCVAFDELHRNVRDYVLDTTVDQHVVPFPIRTVGPTRILVDW